jgi:4-hydroxy-L-threonine phosphate dehydrogenase PdxA
MKPLVGITMGDPLGIGPEVVVKALADQALRASARFLVYGDNELLLAAAEQAKVHPTWFRTSVEQMKDGVLALGDFTVVDYGVAQELGSGAREPSKSGGLASKAFVEDAIADAMRPAGDERRVDAIVTAPISKESWNLAGFRWPGHTELLGARTRAKRQVMAFVSPRLRVALATTHVPLIAVCGLNPHAGENGLFGDEESRIIAPAIEMAKSSGVDAHGPFSADTLFIDAAAGAWDLVVAMYHDQGLVPVKLLGWDKAVNVTLGLPIVRTSPDHGTAFGIAGKGVASEGSMQAAVALAVRLAKGREAMPC